MSDSISERAAQLEAQIWLKPRAQVKAELEAVIRKYVSEYSRLHTKYEFAENMVEALEAVIKAIGVSNVDELKGELEATKAKLAAYESADIQADFTPLEERLMRDIEILERQLMSTMWLYVTIAMYDSAIYEEFEIEDELEALDPLQ